METVRLELLGPCQLVVDGKDVVEFEPGKPLSLLGYLVLHAGKRYSRDFLMEVLWPEGRSDTGRSRLRQTLLRLRQILGSSLNDAAVLTITRDEIGIDADRCTLDVDEFRSAVTLAREAIDQADYISHLSRAVRLYRGELLENVSDEWIRDARVHLAYEHVACVAKLAELYEGLGELVQALKLAHQCARLEPLDEGAHIRIMRLSLTLGYRAEAISQYRLLERVLHREWESTPGDEARALFKRALEGPTLAVLPGETVHRSQRASNRVATSEAFVGGALPLNSRHYVERRSDASFHAAVKAKESIVLVKGPRQVGKTSLLARAADRARIDGANVVHMDFQKLNDDELDNIQRFYCACCQVFRDQLNLEADPVTSWDTSRSANGNFERYVRIEVLEPLAKAHDHIHLVWCLDEVDRLFNVPFSQQVFALLRSWHNERALDPDGYWSHLTIAIAYATEAHYFIRDINQSPFNVGVRIVLQDFNLEEVAELNRRHGSPIHSLESLSSLHVWTGGCPYLVQLTLSEAKSDHKSVEDVIHTAHYETSPFWSYLQRLRRLVEADAQLTNAIGTILKGGTKLDPETFYRLRAIGLLTGASHDEVRIRCTLYADFFKDNLVNYCSTEGVL